MMMRHVLVSLLLKIRREEEATHPFCAEEEKKKNECSLHFSRWWSSSLI